MNSVADFLLWISSPSSLLSGQLGYQQLCLVMLFNLTYSLVDFVVVDYDLLRRGSTLERCFFFYWDVTREQGQYQMTRCFTLFDLVYNMFGFRYDFQKLHFSRQTINFNNTTFAVQDSLELRIKSRDYSQAFFDPPKLTITSDLTKNLTCENTFFE